MSKSTRSETKDEVRIHIDRERHMSPNPTTGAALYHVGSVEGHRELFREVEGDGEDQLIPNDEAPVELTQDEHFYSQPDFRIIVNAEPKEVAARRLSFAEVVKLAFPAPPSGSNILYTITYRHGPKANREGSLLEGSSVKIRNGMIFNVTATDKS